MKTAKLPIPILVLISAVLFLFSSTFGEWIGRSSTSPVAPRQTTEPQEAAIVYVRAMSWLAEWISHSNAQSQTEAESAQTDVASPVSTRATPAHRVQLCALSKPSRPSRGLCKSWQFTIQDSPHSLTRLVTVQRTAEN